MNIAPLLDIIKILAVVCLFLLGYAVTSFINRKTIKTKNKPKVTWELQARGQKVDTVWIYKF